MRRLIRIDPLGGVAGDMFAAAMLDAFPDAASLVEQTLAAIAPPDVSMTFAPGRSGGFAALGAVVASASDTPPPRDMPGMRRFYGDAPLPAPVAGIALSIFDRLAVAEAQVHGADPDSVHFHEVSDWDSILDITAAALLIDHAGPATWVCAPLPLGGGTVKTAHGPIPVPAPATLALAGDLPWRDDGVGGERVTPTGAAILSVLAPGAAPAAPLRLTALGVGRGTRDLGGVANILRISVFDAGPADDRDTVLRLAMDIDDMTGEEIGAALDHLRALDGVLDVATIPMQGKKGRPLTGLRLLIRPEVEAAVTAACFDQTTTLGIRVQTVERHILRREALPTTPRSKRAHRPAGATTKAEADDLTGPTLAARRRQAQGVEHDA